jgi:hypothetical protein
MEEYDKKAVMEEMVRKAAAWDAQKVAERNVPKLREVGDHELADEIEKLAQYARALAEERDSLERD